MAWVYAPDGTVTLPVRNLATEEILYGGQRTTSYRYEVLRHNSSTGADSLVGFLDGVAEASLSWTWNASVKGSGTMKVIDLSADQTAPGYLRFNDLDLFTARIRPVMIIEGLPEFPLGVYLVTEAPEEWDASGHTITLGLLEKTTVLDQDAVAETFTANTTSTILAQVQSIISSSGETIAIDATATDKLANPRVWDVGTTKLEIVNDLLDVMLYNSLTIDGLGNFLATPNIRPAARPITYEMLNGLPRQLTDGAASIYLPEWTSDIDLLGVPNKVIAVANSGADGPPLQGVATNQDTNSPFSYQKRGRWITNVLDGIEVPAGTQSAQTTFLNNKARQSLIAQSSPQASRQVKHLPIPVRIGDVLRFRATPAGIDTRHVITSLQLDCKYDGLMSDTLQEVIDL